MSSQKRRDSRPPAGESDDCNAKVKRLEKWLLSPDRAKRMAAINEIFASDCPEKKNILIKNLAHSDPTVRRTSVELLEQMREEITEDDILNIAVFLNSNDSALRHDVVNAISRVLSEDYAHLVSDSLMSHLDNEDDAQITNSTVIILWSIKAVNRMNRSFEELLENLFDSNDALKDSTLKMVRRYRSVFTTADISVISRRLEDEKLKNQLIALEALKLIDRPSAVASALMSFFDHIGEKDPSAIDHALRVLGSMRRDTGIEEFLRSMQDSEDARYVTYRRVISDILEDTMRLIPGDAIKPKETVAEEILFNFIQQHDHRLTFGAQKDI